MNRFCFAFRTSPERAKLQQTSDPRLLENQNGSRPPLGPSFWKATRVGAGSFSSLPCRVFGPSDLPSQLTPLRSSVLLLAEDGLKAGLPSRPPHVLLDGELTKRLFSLRLLGLRARLPAPRLLISVRLPLLSLPPFPLPSYSSLLSYFSLRRIISIRSQLSLPPSKVYPLSLDASYSRRYARTIPPNLQPPIPDSLSYEPRPRPPPHPYLYLPLCSFKDEDLPPYSPFATDPILASWRRGREGSGYVWDEGEREEALV